MFPVAVHMFIYLLFTLYVINIQFFDTPDSFDYPDFTEVPMSLDNRGLTVTRTRIKSSTWSVYGHQTHISYFYLNPCISEEIKINS